MKIKQTIDHITDWLNSYVNHSKMKGFTVGVSGGIDSAVTSTLCAGTKMPVLVLNMPIYQPRDQVSRSSEHILWLKEKYPNVTRVDLELSGVFDTIRSCLPDDIQDGLSMANTRSRLRMLSLYAFAGHHRMLVAGTGNKVEDFGVGFYTKYGDGGVDLSPIADLMKTEVYEIGRQLGIIDSILTAAPTDGLWDDERTDETQIGATYAELEWAMNHLSSGSSAPLSKRQKEILNIYQKYHSANRHKMDPIPVCMIPDELR